MIRKSVTGPSVQRVPSSSGSGSRDPEESSTVEGSRLEPLEVNSSDIGDGSEEY
jgi:hypothetical protein